MNPNHRPDRLPTGVKLLGATMGVGALLAFGAVTVAATGAGDTGVFNSSPEASLGETTTETTAPTKLETPFATPPITSTEEEG